MNDRMAGLLTENHVSPDLFQTSDQGDVFLNAVLPCNGIVGLWMKLAAASRDTGYYPVIRGDASEQVVTELDHDPAAILSKVPTGSVQQLLMPRLRERAESLKEFAGELPVKAQQELMPALDAEPCDYDALAAAADRSGIYSFGGEEKFMPWPAEPKATPQIGFHTTRQAKGKPMLMSLVRLQNSFELPAYLNFGGWNECPEPELQVAALREWKGRYEARPACITGDVLECIVPRPPQTEPDAMILAAEQWIFCDDIVGQGTQSIRSLAFEIWHSKTWFFWWD